MANRRGKNATVEESQNPSQRPETEPENDKTPRTERGRKTKRAILDAAAIEFGSIGFGETSIVSITRRANVALGSFYTYFDSKEAVFRALVQDLSGRVKDHAASGMVNWDNAIDREKSAFTAFLRFAREHKEIYRIIDEAEFTDPEIYRAHYTGTAERILARLKEGSEAGDLAPDMTEAHAWAIMGMNVFLGLRFGVWSEDESVEDVAAVASQILSNGIVRR